MSNIWNLDELTGNYNDAKSRVAKHLKELAIIDINDVSQAKRFRRIARRLYDAADAVDFWARYLVDFDSVVELQAITDHLHTIMPDVWPGKRINYYADKDFWECDGRLLGRDTAKSALQTIKDYCRKQGVEIPAKE